MPLSGSKFVFDEPRVTVKAAALVSASPTVNWSALVDVSSSMERLAIVEIVGGVSPPVTVKIPEAETTVWPSGFVMLRLRAPVAAAAEIEMFRVTLEGFPYKTLFTVMPAPLNAAVSRFEKPAPGSKKPEPFVDTPLTNTFTFALPAASDSGLQLSGVAGGGARTFTTRNA